MMSNLQMRILNYFKTRAIWNSFIFYNFLNIYW